MSPALASRWLIAALVMLWIGALPCRAQVPLPGSYDQYYQTKIPSYSGTSIPTSSRYLYDKYFYHRPTVSPYLNLGRPGSEFGTSYQAYVRPELERREAAATAQRAYVQQRKLEGRAGETRSYMKPNMPSQTTPSAYHNHWYGGWANR